MTASVLWPPFPWENLDDVAALADTDLIVVLDRSDTTMSPNGTTKTVAASVIADYIVTADVGGTAANPRLLDPVNWFAVNSASSATQFGGTTWTYADGTAGVGATITSDGNGALIDLVATISSLITNGELSGSGDTPAIGDRVLFVDNLSPYNQGIYKITSLGSVSTPWVLTRTTDNDQVAESALDYRVDLEGTNCYAVTSRYDNSDALSTGSYGWAVYTNGGIAVGPGAITFGERSMAIGYAAETLQADSVAIGVSAIATKANQIIIGSPYSFPAIIQGVVTAKTNNYTLVIQDMGKLIPVNKATAVVVTIPLNASVAYPVGTSIQLGQIGVGAVGVTIGGGGTLLGALTTKSIGQVLTITKRATNTWSGQLSMGTPVTYIDPTTITTTQLGNILINIGLMAPS